MHTSRAPRLLDARFILGAIAGIILGSLVTMALAVVALEDDERGEEVRIEEVVAYIDGVRCNHWHDFCLVEPEPGEVPVAFYAFTTHDHFRAQGCMVEWDPELAPPQDLTARGVFTSPCGGSMWTRDGERLFGPAPDPLDRFPTEIRDGVLIIDTRELICEGPGPCERAPLRP